MPAPANNDGAFADALQGLRNGDFSRLAPLFEEGTGAGGRRALIIQWYEQGRFSRAPDALNEALSCACFNGRTSVADYLMTRGVDPAAGTATGMDALHWAANRGQLETVRLLLRHKAPLETRNRYNGTVLGFAVWSALHEPRRDQLQIIEELLRAGADAKEAGYPTGNAAIDALLERHGAA